MTKMLGFLTATICTFYAFAQEMQEIVVTGSRISAFESDTVPVIHLTRRADFMVVNAYIESDSREAKLRAKEVRATLRALESAANKQSQIEIGLLKIFETDEREVEYVAPFAIDDISLMSGRRPDTTRVEVVIKTPILDEDRSPEHVEARIDDFMKSVAVTGRATIAGADEPGLSIVNLAQYREPLLRLLAADNAKVQEVFGSDYRIRISGLEEPVRWRVTGPMKLAIYFPYYSSAEPE